MKFSQDEINQINKRNGIHIFKSEDYFKWRIDDNDTQFTYLCIYIKESLQGYAIYRNGEDANKRVVEIVDWYVEAGEAGMKEKVFARLILEISKETTGSIFIPFTNLEMDELAMMKKTRFILEKNKNSYIMYKILNPQLEEKLKDSTWNLKMIDADTIMN